MSEDKTDINRGQFAAQMASGELTERVVGLYGGALQNLDRMLFDKKEGIYAPGWRDQDVSFGRVYLAPYFPNVPSLMDQLGRTIGALESRVNTADKDEVEKLAAWTLSTILRIHPKLDGNGRLSKAAAEVLAPHKSLLEHTNPIWPQAIRSIVQEMMVGVAQSSGQQIPDSLLKYDPNTPLNIPVEAMRNFYFFGGADWPAYILQGEMQQVGIDARGRLASPFFSTTSFNQMLHFVGAAPDRTPYPKPATTLVGRTVNLIRSRR